MRLQRSTMTSAIKMAATPSTHQPSGQAAATPAASRAPRLDATCRLESGGSRCMGPLRLLPTQAFHALPLPAILSLHPTAPK